MIVAVDRKRTAMSETSSRRLAPAIAAAVATGGETRDGYVSWRNLRRMHSDSPDTLRTVLEGEDGGSLTFVLAKGARHRGHGCIICLL